MKKTTLIIILLAVLVVGCFTFTGCERASKGLEYWLYSDSYWVSGIGTCTDTNIVIPKMHKGRKVTGIKSFAFCSDACSSIENIVIPNTVISMSECAFSGCNGLTTITIPNSVTGIYGAFSGCASLENVIFAEGSKLERIDDGAFARCPNLKNFTVPSGVKIIGDKAFYGCENLESITLPDSVTHILEYAFYGCKSLVTVSLGNGLTTIRSSAFSECNSLTSIIFPSSLTKIEKQAFSGCWNLESIYYEETSVYKKPSIDYLFLENNNPLQTAEWYYYSEKLPTVENTHLRVSGYWHYVDGEPTLWQQY